MKVYYHTGPSPGNFGDILNKWLIEKISGETVEISRPGIGVYICIGSIIKFAGNKMLVWGTGAMRMNDRPSKTAQYFAVRGPLTREVVLRSGGDCPKIYGDPALLLPKFYLPKIEKKHKVGIIPHYIDYKTIKEKYPEHKVINLLNSNPLEVIDEILSCETTLSSSLHGLIVSHAYGIPSGFINTISAPLNGDGTKFNDYFLSVGIKPHAPYDARHLDSVKKTQIIEFDAESLLNACPFLPNKCPKVISFYTRDYLQHANRLRGELNNLRIKHSIIELNPIGEWIDNTRLKGRLVANHLKDGPVLWMDVDSSMHQKPIFFVDLDADFAAYPKKNPERPWSVGHLWFNNTKKGIELAEAWAKECENAPQGVSDEWALAKAWKSVKNVRAVSLPKEYFDYRVKSDTVMSIRLSGNASKYTKSGNI